MRVTRAVGTVEVIPEVSGNAYICGFGNWILDARDPQTHGFLVR